MPKSLIKLLTAALLIIGFSAQALEIEDLGDGLYRFIDDRHRSVFLITPQGAIVTDPLNKKAATWLNEQIKTRFNVPVKYVIYSHNHSDHIYGAEAFKSPHTTFVAHTLSAQDIKNTQMKTVTPDLTFDDELVLTLGDSSVKLNYHGPNDGRGSVSMLFEKQKTLFVVDWILIGRMPWQKLWSYDIQGMINSTKAVLNYDFDTFVGGHADIGNKADVKHYLSYIEQLYSQVTAGALAGKTLDEIKQNIQLDEFKDFRQYEAWLPLNIEGVYERLMEESGMGWRSDL
ncbi:MBL fold metallo-hydrolase [Colwellia sp. M166]|uniref:MBL fold metallo-hydrolase n=1 Tax=Colwellia sp. M166 TaxID=2583805 RepID=UPI00211EA690|nr:MBL fold metallo-hydrolase [Colwellia sp. M166]UUO24936.1 MBL fold metallo-hydrolase [Colwellia sp. M166]|tara:strand:- start:3133 stop:3990 length:858 start_codon:yes stop_codon:yes gene_type:complete